MVSIKDIAQLTGVSTATVSNVLNGKSGAASDAKAREITEIAKNLKYIPNSIARSLKQKKTNSIGIITEDLTVFNTPEIVDGVDAFCEENGYQTIIGNMRLFKRYNNDFTDTPKHHELLDTMILNMLSKQVEGIVYIGYHCREIHYLPNGVRVPFCYAYCYPSEGVYPSVMFDDERAAFEVTNLLIKNGHHDIGLICGPAESYHTQARLNGFKKSIAKKHLTYDEKKILYGDWERLTGYKLGAALIDMGVSAIFAFNDLMASGVYECAEERGLKIGKDISLFGFDNRDISNGYIPGIATVEAPLADMGRKCAEIILTAINKHRIGKKRIYLPCSILLRGSLARYT
jgi:LacI family transcriptional regulator